MVSGDLQTTTESKKSPVQSSAGGWVTAQDGCKLQEEKEK